MCLLTAKYFSAERKYKTTIIISGPCVKVETIYSPTRKWSGSKIVHHNDFEKQEVKRPETPT